MGGGCSQDNRESACRIWGLYVRGVSCYGVPLHRSETELLAQATILEALRMRPRDARFWTKAVQTEQTPTQTNWGVRAVSVNKLRKQYFIECKNPYSDVLHGQLQIKWSVLQPKFFFFTGWKPILSLIKMAQIRALGVKYDDTMNYITSNHQH